jgi:hypothetical protein
MFLFPFFYLFTTNITNPIAKLVESRATLSWSTFQIHN